MRIVWDAALASAAGERFEGVSPSVGLAAGVGASASATDPNTRERAAGLVGNAKHGAFRGVFGVKVLRKTESRKDRIVVDHPWHCICCASLPKNVSHFEHIYHETTDIPCATPAACSNYLWPGM